MIKFLVHSAQDPSTGVFIAFILFCAFCWRRFFRFVLVHVHGKQSFVADEINDSDALLTSAEEQFNKLKLRQKQSELKVAEMKKAAARQIEHMKTHYVTQKNAWLSKEKSLSAQHLEQFQTMLNQDLVRTGLDYLLSETLKADSSLKDPLSDSAFFDKLLSVKHLTPKGNADVRTLNAASSAEQL